MIEGLETLDGVLTLDTYVRRPHPPLHPHSRSWHNVLSEEERELLRALLPPGVREGPGQELEVRRRACCRLALTRRAAAAAP